MRSFDNETEFFAKRVLFVDIGIEIEIS